MHRTLLLCLLAGLALAPAASAVDDRVVDRISFGPAGGNDVIDAAFAGMSRDGNCVAFSTREQIVESTPGTQGAVYESCGAGFISLLGSGDVVALNDTGTCALFASRAKICGNTTRTVAAGTPRAISGDGACAIVVNGASILRDCDGAAVETVASDATYGGASVDANCVAYATTTAGAGDLDSARDVYKRCGGGAPEQMSVTVNHLPEVLAVPATDTAAEVPGKPVRDPAVNADAVGISPNGDCVVFRTSEDLTATGSDEAARDTGAAKLWKRCGSAPPAVELPTGSVAVNAVGNGGCFAYTAGSALSSTCPANPGLIANGGTFAGQADDGGSIAWTAVDGAHQLRGGEDVLVSRLRSGGGPTLPAFPGAVSADGATVAFVTQSQLVKDDTELARDVYKLHPGPVLFADSADPVPETPPGGGGFGGGGGGGGGALGAGTAGNSVFTITGLVPAGTLTSTNASAADRRAPRLFGLALEPASLRARQTATLRFALSEPATVTVTVERRLDGRRRGSRCVTSGRYARGKGSRKARRAKPCVRWVRTGNPVSGDAGDGLTRLAFRPGNLAAGRYRVVAGARDGAGNATPKPRTAGFKVRR